MTEKRKSPALRFRGYTDDWEQRKLGDVLERRIEQRQQSEEYPRLAFASGQGVIPLSERKNNNREQLTKDEYTKKYLVTELNDIVYNPANVKYGAIDRNKCGRGLISPIYVTFTTNEISGFIERIVTSHDFQQRSLRFEEGTVTKRQSVNPEDLVTLDILVAPKREEQQKIATYFDNLDRLITLHQRKLELRFFPGCMFFIWVRMLTWCPSTKEQGIGRSEAPRPTGRSPILSQRRGARRRKNKALRGAKHHAQPAEIRFCSKDVVPGDERTRHCGERSTTFNRPNPILLRRRGARRRKNKALGGAKHHAQPAESDFAPKTWCPSTEEQDNMK